jgi:hypothetical protein
MKNLILILILTAILALNSFGQEIKYAAFNVVSSGIIGGIGSGIHKKNGETFLHAFCQGTWKGSLAGSLNVVSKEMLSVQAQKENLDWKLCWGSKIVNSFSNTILYNATMNESKLFKNYSINIGFVRLNTNHKVQVDAISFGCFAGIIIAGGKLNSTRTLITGTPFFDYNFKRIITTTGTVTTSKPKHFGQTLAQNIIIQNGHLNNHTQLHEIIHTYQRLEISQVNNLFKIYNKYENLKFIHNDISSFDLLYFLQNKIIGYSKNYFEKEANNYSN